MLSFYNYAAESSLEVNTHHQEQTQHSEQVCHQEKDAYVLDPLPGDHPGIEYHVLDIL